MSSTSEQASSYKRDAYAASDYDDGRLALGGWLLLLGGLWSFFTGLGVVARQSYFTSQPGYAATSHYAFQWSLSGWGWFNLILGAVVVAVAVCALLGQTWTRWVGIIAAIISGIGSFLFLPFFPLWSILVIAVDVIIIWAMVTARQPQDT